jgi:uncharacterized protein YhaN
MQIDELHVESFGALANLSFKDIPSGMAIILGDNEAGKTTLLAFLRSILFGLPTRLQKEFYPTVNGARKGGRIIVSNEQAKGIVVERFEGKGSGSLTVTFPDGSKGGQEEFRQIIGSATEELYSSVFAFSLAELQTFESLKTDKVRDAMYSAGLGVGRKTIPEVMKELQKQSRDLFAKAASKPKMNKLLADIDLVNQALRDHVMDQDEYGRIHDELRDSNDQIKEIVEKLSASRNRQSHVQRLRDAWGQWMELSVNRDLLEELPVIDSFPEEGVHRLEILKTRKTEVEDQLREALAKNSAAHERVKDITVDHTILATADGISELDRGLDLHVKNGNELSSLTSEALVQEQNFQQSLSELGEEWNEENLSAFDLSVSSREEFNRHRQNLLAAKLAEGEQNVKHSQQQRLFEETSLQQLEVEEGLDALPKPSRNLKVDSIQQLQAGIESYVSAKNDLPLIETETNSRVENLEDTLRIIGPDWDEAKLESFDASLAVQEQVSTQQKRLGELQSRKSLAAKRFEDAFTEHRDASAQLAQSEATLSTLPSLEMADEALLANQLRNAKTLRREFGIRDEKQSESDHLRERKKDQEDLIERLSKIDSVEAQALPFWLAPVVAVVGVVCAVGFWLLNGSWVEGVVLCTILFVIAGFLFFRKPTNVHVGAKDSREQEIGVLKTSAGNLAKEIQALLSSIEKIDIQLSEQATELDLKGLVNHSAIDEIEHRLEQQLELMRDRKPLEQKSKEEKQRLQLLQKKIAAAKEANELCMQELKNAEGEWQAWLDDVGFPETLAPETANHILTRLDAAREQLKEIKRGRIRVLQIKEKVDLFEAQVTEATIGAGEENKHLSSPEKVVAYLVDCMETSAQQGRSLAEQERLLEDCKKKTKKEKKRLETEENNYENSKAKVKRCGVAWEGILAHLGLAISLRAETAESIILAIVRSKDKYDNIIKLRQRKNNLQNTIDDYHQKVGTLMQKLGRVTPEIADISSIVSGLVGEIKDAENLRREFNSHNEKIAEIDVQIGLLEDGLRKREDEITSLFDAAQCGDEDIFRRNATNFEKRRTTQDTINNLQIQLKNQADRGMEFSLLEKELQKTTKEDLAREAEELARGLDELDTHQRELADEGGRLKQQLMGLEKSVEVSTLRNKLQSNISLLESNAEQWSALKITEYLIDRAREKYERERRPGVLKEAEKYFSRFTGGAYSELHAPLDKQEIMVRALDGTTKNLNQLSTGTAEQLYLSLRFGFVREFVQRSEPLPLIFDDILVNFDPTRARAAGEAIVELAKSLQTLFFTCQPTTVALLRDIAPSIPVYNLESGELTRQLSA